jgi:F420-non-reducing hydrogenase large subunit
MLHSHGIHFFAMAGPDLMLGIGSPAEKRSIIGLLEHSPDLAKKALRLRTIGQKIAEIVGGRGIHPVTAVAGGMAASISKDTRETLRALSNEGLELAKLALAAGKEALNKNAALLEALPLSVTNMGTLKDGALNLYDGILRARRPDGSVALEFSSDKYRDHLYEEALPFSYGKQVVFRDPQAGATPYRVGPLARINASDRIDTPLANEELGLFKSRFGNPCDQTVLYHYARLIEMLYCAELAVQLVGDDEIISPNVRTPISATPHPAIAHVEAPRGVLIHDYQVDKNGIIEAANFLVATQHNISSINSSIKTAASHFWGKPDAEFLNGIEFAIRCYDPCLSCSTHQIGSMPLDVTIAHQGKIVRSARR